jgi:hypothetical protein
MGGGRGVKPPLPLSCCFVSIPALCVGVRVLGGGCLSTSFWPEPHPPTTHPTHTHTHAGDGQQGHRHGRDHRAAHQDDPGAGLRGAQRPAALRADAAGPGPGGRIRGHWVYHDQGESLLLAGWLVHVHVCMYMCVFPCVAKEQSSPPPPFFLFSLSPLGRGQETPTHPTPQIYIPKHDSRTCAR